MHNEFICLIVKLGLFFANCDGEYHPSEKSFIRRFLINLQTKELIDEDGTKLLKEYESKSFTLGQVTDDSLHFLKALPDEKREDFKSLLTFFIRGIIEADHVIAPEEEKCFEYWEHHTIYN